MTHFHRWREYALRGERGVWYRGWICAVCGEQGYGVPA